VPENGAESANTIRVDKSKLAAWLRFNDESLVSRDKLPNGKIAYFFRQSDSIAGHIETWESRRLPTMQFNKFASIVSQELRLAHRVRASTFDRSDKNRASRCPKHV